MYQVIEGDLLTCPDPIICQQLNCLCVKGHGLSADIAKVYPYANVYAERRARGTRNLCIAEDAGVPGEIVVRSGFGPIVIGFYGQYDYGTGRTGRTSPTQDNSALREIWFKECLVNLEIYMKHHRHHTVAFPYGIGCGLAGGNWDTYSQMIQDYAERTGFTVNVYKKKLN
jgi:hypothetical protein